MQEVPKDIGKRIVEAAKLAAALHLEQEAKEAAAEKEYDAQEWLRGIVGDILPDNSREAA